MFGHVCCHHYHQYQFDQMYLNQFSTDWTETTCHELALLCMYVWVCLLLFVRVLTCDLLWVAVVVSVFTCVGRMLLPDKAKNSLNIDSRCMSWPTLYLQTHHNTPQLNVTGHVTSTNNRPCRYATMNLPTPRVSVMLELLITWQCITPTWIAPRISLYPFLCCASSCCKV